MNKASAVAVIKKAKKSSGTHEWAEKTYNFSTGCSHNCRYCYGRQMAVRFRQVAEEDWATPRIRQHDVDKRHRNYGKTVMFPSSHDLTPDNVAPALIVLGKLLRAGNQVTLVSKPHLEVIRAICEQFGEYRHSILFRFTISSTNNDILAFWEPGAPTYDERRAALAYAFDAGFVTSVSAEPMLDAENIDHLVADLMPHVNHSIWIGKMNYLGRIKVDGPEVEQELARIRAGQTDDRIIEIYNRHRDNPVIRWKGSIKDIVGIERAPKPGMDI